MRIGLGLSLTGFMATGFSPLALFAASEQGAWYDPSDLTTLYQDTAGTTPVTALGQSVALALDKSKGLVRGAEMFADQPSVMDNSGGGATVVHTAASRSVQVTVAGTNNSYPRLQVSMGLTAGRRYEISGRIDGDRSKVNLVRLAIAGTTNSLAYNIATGVFSGIQEAGATPALEVHYSGTLTGSITIATISVKELPGNHATQATAAARPILRQTAGGVYYLEDDLVDDTLNWTAPAGNYTVAWVDTAGTVTIQTAQALTGATDALKAQRTAGYLAINRALTAAETSSLTAWLKAKAGA